MTDLAPSSEVITDPFEAKVGQTLLVPSGTVVTSLNPRHEASRTLRRDQRVVPHFVNRYTDGRVVITWAGSGGYWQRWTVWRRP